MSVTGVLLLASTCLYAGFQWTIRVLAYPQFREVPTEAFPTYELAHQRRVSLAVGPLFVFAGASAIAAFAVRPAFTSGAAAGCMAAVVVLTAFAAVPAHRRLSAGFDTDAHRRLLIVDSARLLSAALACVAAGFYASGR